MNQNIKCRKGLEKAQRIVIKFGTSALSRPQGGIDHVALHGLVDEISQIVNAGIQVVLVSSGAIHAGRHFITGNDDSLEFLMACSAVGQPKLLHAYDKAFSKSDKHIAQVLLTHDDFQSRIRHINARNTLLHLLNKGIIPILNENDSISYREIAIGDNDQLAAMAAGLIDADALIVLTAPDGIYDRDPDDPKAEHIARVEAGIDLQNLKFGSKSTTGRGGMQAKLWAIRKASAIGIPSVIASFRPTRPIIRALTEEAGTFFAASSKSETGEKEAWMLATARFDFAIHVDAGAYAAINKSASLLPAGIAAVKGEFKAGDCVVIVHQGNPFAVGIAEYDAEAARKIAGKSAKEIAETLGFHKTNSVIHTRNIVLRR